MHLFFFQDSVEAARTATINQEIKRVLTEVLLKVSLLANNLSVTIFSVGF